MAFRKLSQGFVPEGHCENSPAFYHPDYIGYFEKRRCFAWRTYRVGNVEKEGESQQATTLVISDPFAKCGVKVQFILDLNQRTEKYSSADFIRNAGICGRILLGMPSRFAVNLLHALRPCISPTS